jgi:hypothetical protein
MQQNSPRSDLLLIYSVVHMQDKASSFHGSVTARYTAGRWLASMRLIYGYRTILYLVFLDQNDL